MFICYFIIIVDSDRYGRRSILLSGLIFSLVFQMLFGLSISLPVCMVFRFLSGAFNGITHTALLHNTTQHVACESQYS
jgi:sugar phosphate permease